MSRSTFPQTPQTPPGGQVRRFGARILNEPCHDPYQSPGKLPEPTRCGTCGAVYHNGRWQWIEASPEARTSDCPACRRIHDRRPAGRLMLDGPYAELHRAELVQIARHQAEQERAEHALNRIMDIANVGAGIEITTTDIHLPPRIGEALKRAHDGELTIDFGENVYEVRVHWHR